MRSVSVVIPTIGRPELSRAVKSALEQDYPPTEVLVVADTQDELDLPSHPALRVLRVGPRAGGNVARQAGIEASSSELIALLDDDDEWLGQHLANQINLIPAENEDFHWVATSRLYAKSQSGSSEIWPNRLISPGETIPQYIFRKKSIKGGVGFIQASTMLFPKKLGLEIPFEANLKFHQDISWLIDLSRIVPPVRIIQAPEPSVVYNIGAATVSRKITAAQSVAWSDRLDSSDLRTIGDFILVHSIQGARNAQSVRTMIWTMIAGIRKGRPGPWAFLYALALIGRTSLTRIFGLKFKC